MNEKYTSVLDLGQTLGVKDRFIEESADKVKIGGIIKTPYGKNQMRNLIKQAGGESPTEIEANVKMEDKTIYHRYTVASGQSLRQIDKYYF